MDTDGICKYPRKATIFLFFLNVISCALEAFEVRFSPLSVHQARDVNCIQTFPSLPSNLCLALLEACLIVNALTFSRDEVRKSCVKK